MQQTLRKLYYWLPPSLRLAVRKIVYLPTDLFRTNYRVPPKGLIYTGRGDFIKHGEAWLDFFIKYGSLQKEHNVLDIGSGIGRIALPLSEYLTGEYRGFEAMKVGAEWCIKNIASKHSNFQFKYVPLHNDLYNSKGKDAAKYDFEYPHEYFDMACSISVFTHMIPEEVVNYLKQAALVLKPGGYLVATFFILDEESLALMKTDKASFSFAHSYGEYALMSKKVKSANVAYRRNYLLNLLNKTGFEVKHEVKGSWCGRRRKMPIGFQDILVLKKNI